jgi:hypothetical protein
MKKKRSHNSLWHRLFCLLMAFYVINVSIDAPDGYVSPNGHGEYHEDLSINEIESFSELILEDIFGLHDAIPEHDEADGEEDQITKIFFDWSMPSPAVQYQFVPAIGFLTHVPVPFCRGFYRSNPTEINSPPPETV